MMTLIKMPSPPATPVNGGSETHIPFYTSPTCTDDNSRSIIKNCNQQELQQPAAKCPRCDSFNTKFCYYNNYSPSQPRHFCRTCRRYWTRGGALRNVPIGGGCRKNKKLLHESSSRPSIINYHRPHQYPHPLSSSDHQFGVGGLRLLGGISPAAPIDFQLRSLGTSGSFLSNQVLSSPFTDFPVITSSGMSSANSAGGGSFDNNINTTTLASSIESLSSINEELHSKLQQQRMAAAILELYAHGGTQKQTTTAGVAGSSSSSAVEKPQAILFQGLEMSTRKLDGPTEWFFDSSFAPTTTNICGGGGGAGNAGGVQWLN